MFIGNGRIHLSSENLQALRSGRVSDRIQFMKTGIGRHDFIDPGWVWRENRVREAQVVPEELGIG
jgi:hypothetical protein